MASTQVRDYDAWAFLLRYCAVEKTSINVKSACQVANIPAGNSSRFMKKAKEINSGTGDGGGTSHGDEKKDKPANGSDSTNTTPNKGKPGRPRKRKNSDANGEAADGSPKAKKQRGSPRKDQNGEANGAAEDGGHADNAGGNKKGGKKGAKKAKAKEHGSSDEKDGDDAHQQIAVKAEAGDEQGVSPMFEETQDHGIEFGVAGAEGDGEGVTV